MQPIINAVQPNFLIEYNGYQFNPKSRSYLSVVPQLDGSNRVEKTKKYLLKVSSYITPRRPIPGDDEGVGIQLPAPYEQFPAPGLDPRNVLATVDSEMKIILDKLLEAGKTLRYCGVGMGDLYVNTIDPNTGLFVPDLNYGPHCKISTLRPTGYNKAWYIEWEAEITLPPCRDIDFNNPGKRIQEYYYGVTYDINGDGLTRRQISGKLVIIPPVYRNEVALPPKGYNVLPSGLSTAPGKFVTLQELLAEQAALEAALVEFARIEPDESIIQEQLDDVNEDINSLTSFIQGQMSIPEYNNMFPAGQIPPAAVFGPFPQDDTGNFNAFETADQYRDYVDKAFPIPFNFKRTNRKYEVSYDKRSLSFMFVDEERPSNSFIPGYSDVSLRQNTQTTQDGFKTWNSTITGTFRFPKFIYSSDDGVGYAKVPASANLTSTKIVPKKINALSDFMTLVYQRFALSLLNSGTAGGFIVNPDGTTSSKQFNVSKIIPKSLSISENILGNEISFSITYFITTSTQNIWVHTGHGLPCILASDLNLSSLGTLRPFIDGLKTRVGAKVSELVKYALMVNFSQYSDALTHKDWLDSQKYASNNSRGSANLICDRSFDKPINACNNSADPNQVLPIHLDSAAPLGNLGNSTRSPISILDASFKTIDDILSVIDGNPDLPGLGATIRDAISKGNSIQKAVNAWKSDKSVFILNIYKTIGLPLVNQIIDIVEHPDADVVASNLDYDLLLSNDFGYPFPANSNNLSQDMGVIGLANFSTNTSFSQPLNSTAAFFNPVDQLIINKLLLDSTLPSPENSWIKYDSSLELLTNNTIIRHKLQPKQDNSIGAFNPNNENGPDNFLETYYNETMPAGPDNVVGNSLYETTFFNNYPEDDIIQYMGSPSNTACLRGYALRHGYEIVPPTLLFYGGYKCYQTSRRVSQKIIGRGVTPVYYCEWEIFYLLANTPLGYLATPSNPEYQETNLEVGIEEYDDDLGDIYELVGQ